MEKLEKVEVIREKCGVSYEDAKAALDACDDNVLDAIIWLEKQGKSTKQSASYTQKTCRLFGRSAKSCLVKALSQNLLLLVAANSLWPCQ